MSHPNRTSRHRQGLYESAAELAQDSEIEVCSLLMLSPCSPPRSWSFPENSVAAVCNGSYRSKDGVLTISFFGSAALGRHPRVCGRAQGGRGARAARLLRGAGLVRREPEQAAQDSGIAARALVRLLGVAPGAPSSLRTLCRFLLTPGRWLSMRQFASGSEDLCLANQAYHPLPATPTSTIEHTRVQPAGAGVHRAGTRRPGP